MNFNYDLSRINTKEQLLHFLGVDEQLFDAFLNFRPSGPDEFAIPGVDSITESLFVVRHEIPKKNPARGVRVAWEAVPPLCDIYKALSRRLSLFFQYKLQRFPHPNVFGYVPGRNIRENASQHLGKRHLTQVDIKDFFGSISATKIIGLFEALAVNSDVAEMLSKFLTIDSRLPLGLSPSPLVANAICLDMDEALAKLAASTGAIYSRYSDDITFSSNSAPPDAEKMSSVIREYGFKVADDKTRHSIIGQAHFVTGLSVSDPNAPHIPKSAKKKLRQQIYYARRFGLDDHFRHLGIRGTIEQQREVNRLDGIAKYISFHEPKLSGSIQSAWTKILEKSNRSPSYAPKNSHRSPFVLFFDESEIEHNGNRYLALGISSTQNQEQLDFTTKKVVSDFLSDPWRDGKSEKIEKNGMHFSDATEDLKLKYIETIQALPFQGYIAFSKFAAPSEYEATYLRILSSIIRRRLMAAESQFAHLFFEENDKISRKEVRGIVEAAFIALMQQNNRRPLGYKVDFVKKPAPGVSIPDFLLGVFGKYMKSGPHCRGTPTRREEILFERLRDKCRIIFDVDSGTEYSRRSPISPW